MSTSTTPSKAPVGGDFRDIREELVAWTNAKFFPHMKSFFQTFPEEIPGNSKFVSHIQSAASGAGDHADWARMVELVAMTKDKAYNDALDQIENQAAQITAATDHAAELQKRLDLANSTNAGARDAATRALIADLERRAQTAEIQRDTLNTVIESGRVGASGRASLPHPTAFSGTETDSAKRTSEFNNWRTLVTARFAASPHEYGTELAKIMYAAALLKDTAAAGVHTGVTNIIANRADNETWQWKTVTEFIDSLAKKYANIDLVADAERKLRKLSQQGKYARFTDFLTEFTTLCDQAGWDDTTRVRAFREKLSQAMRDMVKPQINLPARDAWDEWVKMAQILATNLENEEHFRKGGDYHSGGNQGGAPRRDPEAMEVDKMALNKISTAERERRYNQGLCFKCGRAGHISKECRGKPDNRDKKGGGGGQRGGYGARGAYQDGDYQGAYNGGYQGARGGYGQQGQQAGGYGRGNGYGGPQGEGFGGQRQPAPRGGLRSAMRGGRAADRMRAITQFDNEVTMHEYDDRTNGDRYDDANDGRYDNPRYDQPCEERRQIEGAEPRQGNA